MKKILFFVITVTIFCLNINDVEATSSTFYEAEYIDGIYMNKQKANSSTIYYQKARFFRQTGSNHFAYCIDPFIFFKEGSIYEETINPDNLTNEQKEQISLIGHFGYNYKNHYDNKWYAITQFMIWKIADPTGNFYFTDGLNGPKIDIYQQEMKEINTLIENYKKSPSFSNNTYTLIEGEDFVIEDKNQVLDQYILTNQNFTIENNKIIGKNLKEGKYIINLKKKDKIHNRPIIFYQAKDSQSLMQAGDLTDKVVSFNVEVINTELKITKHDKDSNSKTPSGQGSLIGAIYGLYNLNNEIITTITIDQNNEGKITNIPLGNYYLEEIKAPTGYELDNTKHYIEITKENNKQSIILTDKIIKKRIIIYKTYDENNKKPEKNIRFSIYDSNNLLITTIITDENGKAEITLPYGEYKIIQENTTDGYQKVKDINLSVKTKDEEIIYLTDYKIKVPNTKTNFIKHILTIISKILNL